MDRGGRGSHRCAGACAPVPSPDLQRYKAASLLAGRGAAQPAPYSKPAPSRAPSAPRPPGTARALVHALSLASFAAPSRCARSRWTGASAPVCRATDPSKAAGDGQRSTHKRCRVLGLPATPGGAAPSLGAQCSRRESAATRRRRRCAAHVARQRSPGARIRADAVEQQESRDAAAAADTINDGLALRRDGQEGRELPWV